MKHLPATEDTLLIRTDYTDDAIWETVCSEARKMDPDVRAALEFSEQCNRAEGRPTAQPIDELGTTLHIVSDPQYADATPAELLAVLPPDFGHSFLFIADKTCIKHPDHPLLVIDLYSERGRAFRAVPSEAFAIQSNLSLANMDWEEFADNVDEDGIFRGFR
jgi:hypothetical protein